MNSFMKQKQTEPTILLLRHIFPSNCTFLPDTINRIHLTWLNTSFSNILDVCTFARRYYFRTQTSISHLHNLFATLYSYILIKCLNELCVKWFTIENIAITFRTISRWYGALSALIIWANFYFYFLLYIFRNLI